MTALTRIRSTAPADRFDRRLYGPMILGAILNPINSSMIAVSLIPIGVAFGAPVSQTAWLVSALYLATAIGQPVVGRLVDAFGPRRMFLIGTTLTGVAGLLGALAPGLGVLIAARVILGFGTCAGYPAAMYLIKSESRRTGKDSPAIVLTVLSIATQTIAVVGPTLGGLLIGLGGWRTVFSVNVPLALASIVLGLLFLPRGNGLTDVELAARPRIRLDPAGMALFAGTLVVLLLFLMDPHVADLWLLGLVVVLGAAFAWRELRTASPFLDLRVFAGNPALLATYARQLLASIVSYAFLYGFTQWLEAGYGLSAAGAGLVLLPTFGGAILVTAITGRRKEVRGKLLVGSAVQLVMALLLLTLSAASGLWLLVLVCLVTGIPQGLVNLANQNALYRQADPARIGASAGLLRTFAYLGAIVASSANGLFLGAGADTSGLHALALFLVVVAALFLVLTVVDRSLRRISRPEVVAAP